MSENLAYGGGLFFGIGAELPGELEIMGLERNIHRAFL